MRKWVWSCLALVVLAVAGVYLAANHAARYPDSFVGRCAISASRLTSRISPIVLVRATHVLPCGTADCTASIPASQPTLEPIVVEIDPVRQIDIVPMPTMVTTVSRTTPVRMAYAEEDVETQEVSQIDVPVTETTSAAVPPTDAENMNEVEGAQYPRLYQDPHYHHYPCCPYSGRCPQPYPAHYPVLPRADEPEMNKTSPNDAATEQTGNAAGSVETMDCRPTDIFRGIVAEAIISD